MLTNPNPNPTPNPTPNPNPNPNPTRGAIYADQGDGVCGVRRGRSRDLDDVRVQGDDGAVAQQPGRDGGQGVRLHAERGRRASSEIGKGLGSEVGVGPASGLG